ncbi:uncharacterized protein B0T15DRAFT_57117 [Chaetomium strumarium]|uniref:Secreted protein n=1 Tax=Chaetomium strumarium TaxID=1170767 RepID=A0AAJ0H347_9PEZI|nr:hypothetical protein B0T15DRAFT_57117 [Chaetomium strumarium]
MPGTALTSQLLLVHLLFIHPSSHEIHQPSQTVHSHTAGLSPPKRNIIHASTALHPSRSPPLQEPSRPRPTQNGSCITTYRLCTTAPKAAFWFPSTLVLYTVYMSPGLCCLPEKNSLRNAARRRHK